MHVLYQLLGHKCKSVDLVTSRVHLGVNDFDMLKLENQTAIRLFKSASYIRIIGFVRNKNFGVYEGYLKRA